MTVSQLQAILARQHPDSDVKLFWDGADRGEIEAIYFDRAPLRLVLVGDISVYREEIMAKPSIPFIIP